MKRSKMKAILESNGERNRIEPKSVDINTLSRRVKRNILKTYINKHGMVHTDGSDLVIRGVTAGSIKNVKEKGKTYRKYIPALVLRNV